tara:strand:+ start:3362 stop:4318 length:957 start_codon:yes stop_codon:yes gene_type:complete
MHLSKKGQDSSTGAFWVVISIILGLAFLMMFLVILASSQGAVINADFFQSFGCWLSNGIKGGGGAMSYFPTMCTFDVIEDPVSQNELIEYLKNTWWMYHKGNMDYGSNWDEVYPAYAFTPEEDIHLADFFIHLMSHKKGQKTDIIHSDYNYLEEDSPGLTLCFDSSDNSPTIQNWLLEKDETYYIIYYDDQELFGESLSDQVLISQNSNFDRGHLENIIGYAKTAAIAYVVYAGAVIVTVGTVGTGTALYLGGAGSLLVAGELAAATTIAYGYGVVGVGTIAISATAAGASSSYFYLHQTEEGCIIYGPEAQMEASNE